MPGQALLCGQPGNTNWMPWEKKTKKEKDISKMGWKEYGNGEGGCGSCREER